MSSSTRSRRNPDEPPQPRSARPRGPPLRQLRLFVALATSSRDAARAVLAEGRLPVAILAVALACAIGALNAARLASPTRFEALVYGPERSAFVAALLETVGTARTAVLVYLLEQAWAALAVLSALGPLLVWVLGATAVAASAALAAARGSGRFSVFAGYATALALVPSGLVTLALEADPRSPLAALGRLLGLALFLWLGFLFYRGIEACYAVRGSRAVAILAVAAGLFYLVPLALIAAAVVAIVVAAIVLGLA